MWASDWLFLTFCDETFMIRWDIVIKAIPVELTWYKVHKEETKDRAYQIHNFIKWEKWAKEVEDSRQYHERNIE